MNNCECIFEFCQRIESNDFMILKNCFYSITAEALRTINLNNAETFTVENLEVLVIESISST